MKVLLIEDSPTLLELTAELLTTAGHEVYCAVTGNDAVDMPELTSVDIILLDVEMPGLNGFETCSLIREKLDNWIPIIFLTSRSDDASFQTGIDAGGDDYLVKPVSHVILHAKLKAMQRILEMREEMAAMNKSLEKMSQSDSLTGLLNRRAFFDIANRDWQAATRDNSSISIAILDIDYFKPYNDHYGHPEGDTCLKAVAQCLQNSLKREMDIIARYGGEEFIVILPGTSLQGADLVFKRLCKAVEDLQLPHIASKVCPVVTLSIGICATTTTTGRSLNDLVKQADIALYSAKHQGRNRVEAKEFAAHHSTCLFTEGSDSRTEVEATKFLKGHCNLVICKFSEDSLTDVLDHQPDVILIDHTDNHQQELDFCQLLKETPQTAFIPIVLLADKPLAELKALAKKIGANDCLVKPVLKNALLSKISSFLN